MTKRVYESIADAFVAEGVDAFFVLMGDGNMHLTSALHELGVRCLHMRHEHSVCAAAASYATAREGVGVCSVTHGPGFSQIMTALVTAARAKIPLVVFAGETPIGTVWHNQQLYQPPFAEAAGVPYLAVHRVEDTMAVIARAFALAREEQRPVVIGMPADLQTMEAALSPYKSLAKPPAAPMRPSSAAIEAVVSRIATSRRPIIVVGRGALRSGAIEDAGKLADRCGGLLATTLLAKGALADHAFSLGVVGGFASPLAHELGKECDLVIALGASLNTFTLYSGKMFPHATIVQVDVRPRGEYQGLPPPDLQVEGDCKLTTAEIIRQLDEIGYKGADWRSPELANAIATSVGFTVEKATPENSTLDPREVIDKLGDTLPADWEIVGGAGHCAYFLTHMKGRQAGRFTTIRDFGAIGNGLAYAIGVAVAKPQSNVVLFEGDGGLLMHIQELETIRRHGLKILVCVMNDGGFGSEIHVLRAHGLDETIAAFGHEDFARIAVGFGLDGANVSDLDQVPELLRGYRAGGRTAVWNFALSDKIKWSLLPIHPL